MKAIESEIKVPNICIIDWLTPGSVKFNKKISTLSNFLLSKNCLPLLVNFPRTDDIDNERAYYKQVKDYCEQLGLPFWMYINIFQLTDYPWRILFLINYTLLH